MPFSLNTRVHRSELPGDNNHYTTAATIVAIDGDSLGLNYDEREDPGTIHGWWPSNAVEEI